jgi:hypothetical protein
LYCVGGGGGIGLYGGHSDLGDGSWWRLEGGVVKIGSEWPCGGGCVALVVEVV